MRNVLLILGSALFALGANAQSGTFNQCIGGPLSIGDCNLAGPVDEIVGPDFSEGETFTTNFDAEGPLNTFRCRWNWTAYFPEQCIAHQSWALNYNPLLDDVDCNVFSGVTPPPGVPDQNTGRLFCQSDDPDLSDPFPLSFSNSADIIHTWEVLGGCDPMGEDVIISAGQWEFYIEAFEGQCLLTDDGPMETDITLTVPEPANAVGLLSGLAVLLLIRRK